MTVFVGDRAGLNITGSQRPDRVNMLGVGIDPLNLAQAVAILGEWREEGRRDYVCCVSVHGLVTAQRDREIRSVLNRAGLATEDGMPLVWWCRRAGFVQASRVCGSDLLDAMCALAVERGHRHYFYGGSPDVVEQLAARLAQRHPGLAVAGYRSPPFRPLTEEEDAADIAAINAARPDFVWVGLGMPKQEKWMASHVGRIEAAALIGIGAAFDFHAGTKPRAPLWMRRSGLEWMFRLISEPRRLAGRYLIDNTIFVALTALQLSGRKSYAQNWRACDRSGTVGETSKMKLLISAYACAPGFGSEHAVGWNWTTEAHRQGHEVWALASSAHRGAVEQACRDDPDLAGIHWVFPEVGGWPLRPCSEPKWERTYNLLWQRAALRHARQLHRRVEFDAIHHLTWGGVRAPTFLGSLAPPLIVGPLGGGETSPRSLRDGFHFKARVTEAIRDLSNATITINPLVRRGLADATVIFVKTSDTRRLLSQAMQRKSIGFIELGLHSAEIGKPRSARHTPPRLLYAGRLLYWKGVHIAIRAFAELVRRLPEARFTIVGRGPEENRLKAATAAYGLRDNVDFISWLPQQQLFELYTSHDLLLFPSLHDSSGGVVLEALAHGLPVVCLDLGGPKEIVTPDSGIVVGTAGRNTAEVAAAMADEMFRLLISLTRLSALCAGAIARADQFLLSNRVAKFYEAAMDAICLTREQGQSADLRKKHMPEHLKFYDRLLRNETRRVIEMIWKRDRILRINAKNSRNAD